MEKHILRWSYWLGVACFVIALGWRGLSLFGFGVFGLKILGFTTFYKAGLLFLLTAIATANYAWFKTQKP